MNRSAYAGSRTFSPAWAAVLIGCSLPAAALAQSQGGLYIAGSGFSFEQAATQGIAKNPNGRKFFILTLPPNTDAITQAAPKRAADVRNKATARGAVLLVCQRDIDNGAIDPTRLVPGVVAVRGFPPPGSDALPQGERYFPGENPDNLPKSNEALRRLRAACS